MQLSTTSFYNIPNFTSHVIWLPFNIIANYDWKKMEALLELERGNRFHGNIEIAHVKFQVTNKILSSN
jgi:hypothetical protein